MLRNYKLNIADLPILTRNRFISSGEKEKLCSRKVVATASTSKMVALKMRIFHYILADSLYQIVKLLFLRMRIVINNA